jgi:hypothetical protein
MDEFGRAMVSRDLDRVASLLAEDVVFRSPVVYAPYEGLAAVKPLLAAAMEVLEDGHYTHEIGEPDAADRALVLRARIGDREVEACDFLHRRDDGLIDEIYVMVRPLSAALALKEAMGNWLASTEPSAA